MVRDIPLLVIAYKRVANLERIIEVCSVAGISTIYFAVDGPASVYDAKEVELVKESILKLTVEHRISATFKFEKKNLGCAAAVISAIDWFFLNEPYGVILEDDCIPTPDFFDFMRDSIPLIESDSKIWLASGTQFFPGQYDTAKWVLSRYPMHWGWCTTAKAWNESRSELSENPPTLNKFFRSIPNPELMYWFAGERRAFYGYTDVWDSIYASNMFRMGRYAIVPPSNLVTNTGDDSFATNTIAKEAYTRHDTGTYFRVISPPTYSSKYDRIIRKVFFNISARHYFSTLYTMLLDYTLPGRKRFPHLDSRLRDAIPSK